MTDPFAYLLDAGLPLDIIERHKRDGLSYEQQAEAVSAMIARGESLNGIISEETGEPPKPDKPPPPRLKSVTAADLQKQDIPPIKWVVQNLFPAGLNLLASPPKYGKSWMMLDLCLAVSAGGRFLSYQTNKSDCLYLAFL